MRATVLCRTMKVLIPTKSVIESSLQFLGGCDMVISLHGNGDLKEVFSDLLPNLWLPIKKNLALMATYVPVNLLAGHNSNVLLSLLGDVAKGDVVLLLENQYFVR